MPRNTPTVPPPGDGNGADATPKSAPAEGFITGKKWGGEAPDDSTDGEGDGPGFSSRSAFVEHVLSDA